jgi:hypothetical protein
MLKALAQATLSALSHCHHLMLMQRQHQTQQVRKTLFFALMSSGHYM